jgi:DNA-binding transcriptional regulator YdaS (Cro superfamily)
MQLADYLRALETREREQLADKAGTSVAYLYQIAGKHRRASKELALKIETASGCEVTRQELRPDLAAWAA